ncbi:prolipoprotein diacylglyceryl transferase [Proteinivorax hydrogeniformans]|uniref:Phosphatidylglycerol--prolipoprotein diacylglyceryl transferase n=1 Tax=Proteinivorax hydrogeniformans TaxID=1826727 RepID=A0AAU8HQD6_9FIRM
MDPVAFNLGPIPVYWYGIIIGFGALVALFLIKTLGKRDGLDPDIFDEFLLIALPVGILGARVYYVLFNLEAYRGDLSRVFSIWEGGLAIHGGILAGVLVAYIFVKVKKINFWQFADVVVPGLILAQAIGRWGNYVNQEAYGVETDLPWAMYIDGAYRHPTFFYEFVWNLIVLGGLLMLRKKKLAKGSIFAFYLIGYSFGRFFIEGLRTDSLMIGPLRTAQLVSIALIVIGVGIYYYLNRKKKAN